MYWILCLVSKYENNVTIRHNLIVYNYCWVVPVCFIDNTNEGASHYYTFWSSYHGRLLPSDIPSLYKSSNVIYYREYEFHITGVYYRCMMDTSEWRGIDNACCRNTGRRVKSFPLSKLPWTHHNCDLLQ